MCISSSPAVKIQTYGFIVCIYFMPRLFAKCSLDRCDEFTWVFLNGESRTGLLSALVQASSASVWLQDSTRKAEAPRLFCHVCARSVSLPVSRGLHRPRALFLLLSGTPPASSTAPRPSKPSGGV